MEEQHGGATAKDEKQGSMQDRRVPWHIFGVSGVQGNIFDYPGKTCEGGIEERQLLAEEQGGFRRGRGCREHADSDLHCWG